MGSYLSALRTGSQVIPIEWVGARLKAIQQRDAAAFAAGERLANLAPPTGVLTTEVGGAPVSPPAPLGSPAR